MISFPGVSNDTLLHKFCDAQDGTGPFAVVSTAEGNLAVWPGFGEFSSQEPLTARITDDITCTAAFATTDTSVSAFVGTKTGKVLLLHCINTRSEAVPPTLAVKQVQLAEVIVLASAMQKQHCITFSLAKRTSSSGPCSC